MNAVYLFQFGEFINEAKAGQKLLALIMENQKVKLPGHMSWDDRIAGLNKLNMFTLVPNDLYGVIKDQSWGNGGNSWTGFRAAPGNLASDIMRFHPPAVNLPGGKNEEVGGYEKQEGVKYYDPKHPILNLEFKWNSGDTVTVNAPKKGKVTVPKVCYALNVHVKQVGEELEQGRVYNLF